ncbi:MAG: DUF5916 domain-containing protein [Longimicrobiales bacterium]
MASLSAPLSGQLEVRPAQTDPLTAPRPTLEARRASGPIQLDGVLDDEAWSQADSTDGVFYQTIPSQGIQSRERTVVRVLYDDEKLYVGALLHDRDPTALVAAGLEQDFATQNSDIFGVALDTYWDRQNAFLFAINPAGAVFDAQAFNDQQSVNRAWEGVVEVSTSVHEVGWTVELAIPITTLRFDQVEGPQTWGMNFSRRIRRISEDSSWSPLSRQFRIYKMSRAGTLTGLEGLRQGRNLWVKPFITGVRTDGRGIPTNEDIDGGLDLKWGMTPRLTLDVTALTDFSQVEVDAQQINLSRFSLFFPEKRDFFLENDGIFSFQDARVRNFRTGSGPENFKLFHSRRIGLSSDRTPVPIAGGARLTGRVGDYAIGLLNMQTRNDPAFPGENFSVVRLRKNVLGSSDIGLMVVNRQGTGTGISGDYNRSAGVDANLRLAGGRMLLNSYAAVSDEPDVSTDRLTGAAEVAWRDPLWDASALVKAVGENFNPGIGFVSRQGIRQGYVTVGAHPQPNIPRINELNPYVEVNFFTDGDWTLESREIKPGFGITFLDSGVLSIDYSQSYERLVGPTPIAGIDVPAGEYDFGAFSASYQSDGGRPVSGSLGATVGDFFDGDRTSLNGGLALRPNAHWFLEGTFQHNRLTLAGQSFDANLWGGRLRYGHNTRTFLSAFVQYNQAAEQLQSNVRFNLIHGPLSDIFLVYSERRDRDPAPGEDSLVDRILTLKVTKLLAF